jgi:hypothetical protein
MGYTNLHEMAQAIIDRRKFRGASGRGEWDGDIYKVTLWGQDVLAAFAETGELIFFDNFKYSGVASTMVQSRIATAVNQDPKSKANIGYEWKRDDHLYYKIDDSEHTCFKYRYSKPFYSDNRRYMGHDVPGVLPNFKQDLIDQWRTKLKWGKKASQGDDNPLKDLKEKLLRIATD